MNLKTFTPREADQFINDKIKSFNHNGVLSYASDPFTAINYLIEDEDGPIALGVVRIVNEFKMLIDESRPRNLRSEAIKHLIYQATEFCREHASNESYIVVTGDSKSFENFLTKRFGFQKVEGSLLLKEE